MTINQPNYTKYAKYYDAFELAGYSESEELNMFLDELFGINSVRKILDFSCGTGAQTVGLARCGYKLLACDLNPEMLKIAKKKAKGIKNISFRLGDMCTESYGTFDACISIFNSVGHLTRKNFLRFLKNAYNHLEPGGIFVFDILNYNAMLSPLFAQYEHMDKELWVDDCLVNHVRSCVLDRRRRQLQVNSSIYVQDGVKKPKSWHESWQMQIYTSEQIVKYLNQVGFREIHLFGQNGIPFYDKITDVILVIAQK